MIENRMTKREKYAVDVAITLLAYFRTMVVFLSLYAIIGRAWIGLALCLGVYFVTSHVLTKTIDYPSDETMRELVEILKALDKEQEA